MEGNGHLNGATPGTGTPAGPEPAAADAAAPTSADPTSAAPNPVGKTLASLVPSTVTEIEAMARLIVESGLAPECYAADPRKVAMALLKGLEVGLPPLAAIASIAIVEGRLCIWGQGALALVQRRELVTRLVTVETGTIPTGSTPLEDYADDYGFQVKIWRRGQSSPYAGRFTVGDARRARLWLNPRREPWMLYPRRMLQVRAMAFPVRDGFADCLAGLALRDEIEDIEKPAPLVDTGFLDDDAPAPDSTPPRPMARAAPREPDPVRSPPRGTLPRRRKPQRPPVREPDRIRSPSHLKWVRGHECCIAGRKGHVCQGRIEAMHVRRGTDGGTGIKPSDSWAVPGCAKAHAEQHRNGEPAFEKKYGVVMKDIAAGLWMASPKRR